MPVSGEHDLGEEQRLKNRFLDSRNLNELKYSKIYTTSLFSSKKSISVRVSIKVFII